MANRNNVPFNILPVSADSVVASEGDAPEDLTVGQIGFFDSDTGLAFDDGSSSVPEEFFIAVGVSGGNFRMSAGQAIQKKGILGIQSKDYVAGAAMTSTISGFKPKYDTTFGFRVEYRNSHIYRIQGHNQFSKAFVVKTPCKEDCTTEECMDPNYLAKLFYEEVLLDENNGLSVSLTVDQNITAADVEGFASDLTAGDEVTVTELEALIAFNVSVDSTVFTTSLNLTPDAVSPGDFTVGLNLRYHKLLQTTLIVSPLNALNCGTTTVTSTTPTFEEGAGEDILQKEYKAGAWNGAGPYAVSMTTYTAIGNTVYLADKDTNYNQYTIEYDVASESGWGSYKNPLTTILAVPTGNSTAIASIEDVLATLE